MSRTDAERIERLAARTPHLADEHVWHVTQRQQQQVTAREILVSLLIGEVLVLAVLAAAWLAGRL